MGETWKFLKNSAYLCRLIVRALPTVGIANNQVIRNFFVTI